MKVLTKSKFKIGLECPNKLYFSDKPEFANSKIEDSFLAALAQGGFQVEALARMHYPNGIFINTENNEYELASELTNRALEQESVIIYEAAFLFDGLFIRSDILVKKGNRIKLIEVKAKSFDSKDEYLFLGKRGGIVAGWKPYLFDLAFQKYVTQLSRPEFKVEAWLFMADKNKESSINGLNQMFRILKNGNPRTDIIIKAASLNDIGSSILSEVNVDDIIDGIISNRYLYNDLKFEQIIELFKNAYQSNKFLNFPSEYSTCKRCEFRISEEEIPIGQKSGFKFCFSTLYHWNESDFLKPNTFEIWNYRGKAFNDENRLFLDDLTEDDFNVKSLAGKISSSERQWIQVEKSRTRDNTIYLLKDELFKEMESWKFPLHFIDFETSAVALPFHLGRKPYEQVAFQFSHHQYNENGTIEHKSEFISTEAGEFPNYLFARALYHALINDNGSIFRYAAHENTILNHIIIQLANSNEHDKEELISFFKTITSSTKDNASTWAGERQMIDLRKIVMDYYYNPYSKGSNSIKYLLPACLNSSQYLKKKYCYPIDQINLTSSNFPDSFIWFKMNGNFIINPYKLLPPLFKDWTDDQSDGNIGDIDSIADGGAALMAYAKLQYVDMSEDERNEITSALLKYCELDTLAMVMIYEHFRFDFL